MSEFPALLKSQEYRFSKQFREVKSLHCMYQHVRVLYVLQVQCGVCTEYLGRAGLGIRSSFFEQIAHFLWPKERFACEKEKIAPVPLLPWASLANLYKKSNGSDFFTIALLSWVTRVNCSRRSLKRSNWAKSDGSNSLWAKKGENQWKTVKHIPKFWIFFSQSLIFESNLLESWANRSCCSFLQSNSLTITLLLWATWANRSR